MSGAEHTCCLVNKARVLQPGMEVLGLNEQWGSVLGILSALVLLLWP